MSSPKYSSFKNVMNQNFSIPGSIISYILQRNNNILMQKPSKYIYKISSICKYFFIKLKVISCHQINVEGDYLELAYGHLEYRRKPRPTRISFQEFEKMKVYFCPEVLCTDLHYMCKTAAKQTAPPNIISRMLPKICNNKIYWVRIHNQELTLEEYIFLTANDRCGVIFIDCKITRDNVLLPAEEILAASPNLLQFSLYSETNTELEYCTPLTSQKLANFPPFKYLSDFSLSNVSNDIQASHFIEFLKKNYKNLEFIRFQVIFKADVCPIFIKNFKSTVDSAVRTMNTAKNNILFLVFQ